MNKLNLPHRLLLCISFLACALVLTLSYARTAQADVLGQKEAEEMALSGGANVSNNGLNVWLDANGARALWQDGGAPGGDTVMASMAINKPATTRVCVSLQVNGQDQGARCVPAGAITFETRTWSGLSLADSDDLSFVVDEVGNQEMLFLDNARVEGVAPLPPQGTWDSVGQTFSAHWTPTPGSRHLNPHIACSGDPVKASNDIGIIASSNTVIENADVSNCFQAVQTNRGTRNFRFLADKNASGGGVYLHHNKVSLDVRGCNGCEFGDVNADGVDGGSFVVRDTYRIMEAKQSSNTTFHDIDANCGTTVWGTGAPEGGCHAGFKWLSDRSYGAPFLSENNAVRDNLIQNVSDESISIDTRLNTPTQQAFVGTGQVTAKNLTDSTFTLQSSNWSNLSSTEAGDYYTTVATGPEQCEVLDITGKSGSTFYVSDPTNVLSGLAVGDRVTIGEAYRNFDFSSNTIDESVHKAATGTVSKVAIDTHAGGCNTEIRDNTIVVPSTVGFSYNPLYFHYRSLGIGTASQAVDIRYGVLAAGTYGTTMYAPSAMNSVTGNDVTSYGDISLGTITWNQPYSGFATNNYVANNTLGQGLVSRYLQQDLGFEPNP